MPTKIEWCEETWNPVTGCSPVSAGCDNCYARRMATRLRGRYDYPQDNPFKVTLHPDRLNQPLKWRKPRMIFVCSMGDLFHRRVSERFIVDVWAVMLRCPQHVFIILTKRLERMVKLVGASKQNIWLGVSVEDQKTADERIPELLKLRAAVRWISVEPMLGPVDMSKWLCKDMTGVSVTGEKVSFRCGIRWVVCGGETGPGARSMHPDWPRKVRDQCVEAGVPYFHKQNGMWIADRLADPAAVDTYQFPDDFINKVICE